MAQSIHILIAVSLVLLGQSLYKSQSHWWYSEYPFTHHSLPGGTQTIPILITVSLMVLRLSITHHSLHGCSQTILLHIIVSLVALRLSHYSSEFPWWYSDYPYTYHRLPDSTQSIPLFITISLVELRQSLYSSQSPSWYSDYPFTRHSRPGSSDNLYTHHSLPDGTQTSPILITVSLVVLRLSLNSSQSS